MKHLYLAAALLAMAVPSFAQRQWAVPAPLAKVAQPFKPTHAGQSLPQLMPGQTWHLPDYVPVSRGNTGQAQARSGTNNEVFRPSSALVYFNNSITQQPTELIGTTYYTWNTFIGNRERAVLVDTAGDTLWNNYYVPYRYGPLVGQDSIADVTYFNDVRLRYTSYHTAGRFDSSIVLMQRPGQPDLLVSAFRYTFTPDGFPMLNSYVRRHDLWGNYSDTAALRSFSTTMHRYGHDAQGRIAVDTVYYEQQGYPGLRPSTLTYFEYLPTACPADRNPFRTTDVHLDSAWQPSGHTIRHTYGYGAAHPCSPVKVEPMQEDLRIGIPGDYSYQRWTMAQSGDTTLRSTYAAWPGSDSANLVKTNDIYYIFRPELEQTVQYSASFDTAGYGPLYLAGLYEDRYDLNHAWPLRVRISSTLLSTNYNTQALDTVIVSGTMRVDIEDEGDGRWERETSYHAVPDSLDGWGNILTYRMQRGYTFVFQDNILYRLTSAKPMVAAAPLHLAPNPASDVVSLSQEGGLPTMVEVKNAQGQVTRLACTDGKVRIGSLAPGVYQLRAGRQAARFVKR